MASLVEAVRRIGAGVAAVPERLISGIAMTLPWLIIGCGWFLGIAGISRLHEGEGAVTLLALWSIASSAALRAIWFQARREGIRAERRGKAGDVVFHEDLEEELRREEEAEREAERRASAILIPIQRVLENGAATAAALEQSFHAAGYRVSPRTVDHALKVLHERGLIEDRWRLTDRARS